MSTKRACCKIENVREANVREKTSVLSKGPYSIFIRIRRPTSAMGVHRETVKLNINSWA